MKKQLTLALAVCLGVVGFSGLATAKNTLDPLADVLPGGCEFTQVVPFGTSLMAHWTWENGDGQTKFGGDAMFLVEGEANAVPFELEIEFELEQYEPGTLAEDYFGMLVYRCSNPATDESGSCNGSVLGVRAAMYAAVAEELGVEVGDITSLRASLDGVYVKAMNPGGNDRQNYELVNVCEVL